MQTSIRIPMQRAPFLKKRAERDLNHRPGLRVVELDRSGHQLDLNEIDFKIGRFDVDLGVGYGLTPGSDRLMAKMIIGTELTEGMSDKSGEASKMLRRPDPRLSGYSRL